MSEIKGRINELLNELESALASEEVNVDVRVARYNRLVSMAAKHVNLPHPALGIQLVQSDSVRGNDYNPNKVAPPEMRLLQLSVAKDGITMPVVVADDPETGEHVVVDGFHRTTVCKTVKTVRDSLAGYLPVVKLNKSIEDRITSTVSTIWRGYPPGRAVRKTGCSSQKHNVDKRADR